MAKSRALSLEDQFTFYASPHLFSFGSFSAHPSSRARPFQLEATASYHTNHTNVLIHVICVPIIFFTGLILTHGVPGFSTSFASFTLEAFGKQVTLDATVPFIVAVSYAAYFVLLEPVAGLLYAPLLITLGHLANVLYSTQHDQAMKLATYGFVGSWIAQFVGHGKFEGRAPALLDSLLQSLVLAVFFVWLEVLFFLGYRPALYKRLQNRTSVAVAEYRRTKAEAERKKGK